MIILSLIKNFSEKYIYHLLIEEHKFKYDSVFTVLERKETSNNILSYAPVNAS